MEKEEEKEGDGWRMDGRTMDGETRVREGGLKWTKQASWKSMEAGRDCLRFPRCRLLARFFPQRMKFNYGETRVYRAYPLVSLFCPPLSRFCLSPFFILLFIIFLFLFFFFFCKIFRKIALFTGLERSVWPPSNRCVLLLSLTRFRASIFFFPLFLSSTLPGLRAQRARKRENSGKLHIL